MALVAITREMGSLGIDVAENVSRYLGVPLVHHEIIDAVADRMRVRKSHVMRLLEGKGSLYERLSAADTKASLLTAAEILDFACRKGGMVLRGWGAAFLLHSVPHAVCTRVCAPAWLRTKRMMARLNSDDPVAVAREVRLNDEAHSAVIRRNFNADKEDAENYDVVLSTERLSVDDATEELLNVVRRRVFEETDDSRQRLLDLRLEAHVRVALRFNHPTRNVIVGVAARRGSVTLTGVVRDDRERRDTVATVETVEGVASVQSELRAGDAYRPWGSG